MAMLCVPSVIYDQIATSCNTILPLKKKKEKKGKKVKFVFV
jgi:hypothetical protein